MRPLIQSFETAGQGDRAIVAEEIDDAVRSVLSTLNGGLTADNISPATRFGISSGGGVVPTAWQEGSSTFSLSTRLAGAYTTFNMGSTSSLYGTVVPDSCQCVVVTAAGVSGYSGLVTFYYEAGAGGVAFATMQVDTVSWALVSRPSSIPGIPALGTKWTARGDKLVVTASVPAGATVSAVFPSALDTNYGFVSMSFRAPHRS